MEIGGMYNQTKAEWRVESHRRDKEAWLRGFTGTTSQSFQIAHCSSFLPWTHPVHHSMPSLARAQEHAQMQQARRCVQQYGPWSQSRTCMQLALQAYCCHPLRTAAHKGEACCHSANNKLWLRAGSPTCIGPIRWITRYSRADQQLGKT